MTYDLAVIGAGVVGLAHATLAARAGLKVVVIDRDMRANGASVRNFGFVTVTGQGQGDTWRRARFSRDIWAKIAPQAGIDVLHQGLVMLAHSPLARQVIEEFIRDPMGEGCALWEPDQVRAALPFAQGSGLIGGLHSPHELRVESRTAIPKLAAWLEETQGVVFKRGRVVTGVAPGRVETAHGPIEADAIAVCPGHDFRTLFPDVIARHTPQECKLHMLRLSDPGWRLPHAVMSDFGLLRYRGYDVCPSQPALATQLQQEAPEILADGIHLIVVQSADGSLVVGDSHHYGATVDDFAPESVDRNILDLARRTLDLSRSEVVERWVGVYGSAERDAFIETPDPRIAITCVTSGTGASTAFGLAHDCLSRHLGLLP